ncbi:MAG: type II toxin-antitoxin system PemK/MazF family toxin [Firmicutes bacterium]|nr:type II toxin-antitoxin system PemK/MazF family toxin [Bacillota bacterium]
MNANWRRLSRVQTVSRGDIFYANLNPVIGSEQGGVRPVLILQNDIGNKYSPTTIVAAITSKIKKAKLPTHVELDSSNFDLEKDSVILLEQVRTIDKRRLKEKIARLDEETMREIDQALQISLGLVEV